MEEKNQSHQSCQQAIKNYKIKYTLKEIFVRKTKPFTSQVSLFLSVNIYHGLIKNNLGIITIIPKKVLILTIISYFSTLLFFLYLLT